MHLELGDPLGDASAGAGEERGADPVGDGAEPEIEACRLQLIGQDRRPRGERARTDQRVDPEIGKNAFSHAAAPETPPPAAAGRRAVG